MPAVEEVLRETLTDALIIGIGGFRDPSQATTLMVDQLCHALLPLPQPIHVGDAGGVDRQVYRFFETSGRLNVFRARERGSAGSPWTYAKRTLDCVDSVAQAGGVWLALPDQSCPEGLLPNPDGRACFAGQKNAEGQPSGTWKGAAYAAGLLRSKSAPRVLIYLPDTIPLPEGWGLTALMDAPGWWEVSRAR